MNLDYSILLSDSLVVFEKVLRAIGDRYFLQRLYTLNHLLQLLKVFFIGLVVITDILARVVNS